MKNDLVLLHMHFLRIHRLIHFVENKGNELVRSLSVFRNTSFILRSGSLINRQCW